jgi:hypothetical protein
MKRMWSILIMSVLVLGGCGEKEMFSERPAIKPSPTSLVEATPSATPIEMVATTVPKALTENWAGTWTNSLGEHGNDTLVLTNDGNGNFTGIWSGNINVRGQWLDKTNLKMSGQTTTRSYQVDGEVLGDTLNLEYTATRLNTSGTYTGKEQLTRISK